ncbi:hypothetical protein [Histidinibacterium lentulum]|uniref:Uncharacterized protein n=1 Tax=Histidinibacterium lentulum TaxID=2480588 RepID=A0A3N2R0Z3_9RHOB|nr:hypothetical protein [Histidinibacterium lentulum]ROU01147.1 hypothetical protein EAT49_11530 [Histidinibacterium lentulum]
MIRFAALVAAIGAFAGCEQIARTTDVVAERTVGSPARLVLEPAYGQRTADCVISGATPGELTVIAADATSIEGPAPDVAALIDDIRRRPDVSACIAGTA